MISDLSPPGCEAHGNLQGGGRDRVYADRAYTYRDVEGFSGAWHIRTRNDAKRGKASVRFRVDRECDVLVLYDRRAARVPKWLKSWSKDGRTVATTDCGFNVYSRRFGKGPVALGDNQARRTGAKSMYAVLVRPAVDAGGEQRTRARTPDPPSPAPATRPAAETPRAPRAVGSEIGGGPWRLILSQEGRRACLWDDARTRRCLDDGFASWSDGVLAWNPRYHWDEGRRRWDNWGGNPSSTVWRMIPRSDLRSGVTLRMQMYSEMRPDLPGVEYGGGWGPEERGANLRRVAGTGDFRVGLLQTGGREDTGSWHAYQVRLYPYLHREAKGHLGANDNSNCSFWYRGEPGGRDRLMDDYSQEGDEDGFRKLKHGGELKFGMGPHSPFGEWFDVEVRLKTGAGGKVASSVRVHRDEVVLDEYEHETRGFADEFRHVDAVCLSFNNMRPYANLRLRCRDF